MKLPLIKLEDLKPQRSPFTLSPHGEHEFALKPFSLAAKRWAVQKYGSLENLNAKFQSKEVLEIAELVWFLLEDKDAFQNDYEKFLESVLTHEDQINILNAITLSIGVSQAQANELYKAAGELAKKEAAQTKKRSK